MPIDRSYLTGSLVALSALCFSALGAEWPAGATEFASAKWEAKSGSKVAGEVHFAKMGADLVVKLYVTGATPGDHAMHVHEKGDCSSPDGESAGGHFNPTGEAHGSPKAKERHIGDFGNVSVKRDGTADVILTFKNREKTPYKWDEIVGKSLILHGGKDDLKSQPSGNAGNRIACALIS